VRFVAEAARAGKTGASNNPELTVSELSNAIKRALEDGFGFVRLRGEISGYRGPHASGHCYFGLKDDKAKIDAVIWRGVFSKLRFKPEEGLEVIATGKVTSYPGSSKYQIVIEALEPAGIGALMAQLEERRRKLAAEGLFADERKRPRPFLPRTVGIVTSPTGAVIRDMLHGFAERYPVHVIVWPVRVQGETSGREVAAAIRGFNALTVGGGAIPRPDVLIVARGGGSLEDLWGFNEEIVVRAAAESVIPLISAVGHETDWTLIDHAADARAPTPTKAAEWAVPKYSELIETIADLELRLRKCVRRTVDQARERLKAYARSLPRLENLLALPRQRFDEAERRLARALTANTHAHGRRLAAVAPRLQVRLVEQRIERDRQRLDRVQRAGLTALARTTSVRRTRFERTAARHTPHALAQRAAHQRERIDNISARLRQSLASRIVLDRRALDAQAQMLASLSYQSVLRRGFALVRDAEGRAVRSVTGLAHGDRIAVELADGRADASIMAVDPASPASADPPKPRPAPRTKPGDQGSLF
jgi:exodeoxyribonuclease VII large subunit